MRVFSGIQPTGQLHIGNYLSAIKQWLELQKNQECIFSIADLHSITVPYDSKNFQKIILNKAIEYISCGINPEKSIIFIQSKVKEHTELCWLLNSVVPVGELMRMTQYKDKSRQFKNNVNAGLLDYPVLMAADILLYQTDIVPIGQDQKQHLELTKTIARKFNQKFGRTFKEPKPLILKSGAKIMALNDPRKKMSKSIPETCLFLFDEQKIIKRKIMSAVTDTGKTIKFDPKRKPGISNLLTIYSLFTDKSIQSIEKDFNKKGYVELKKSLIKLLDEKLEVFRRKKKEMIRKEVYTREILKTGAKRAEIIAKSNIEQVRKKMGLM